MTELKPCPFCGGKAEYSVYGAGSPTNECWYVHCSGCCIGTHGDDKTKEDVTNTWNARI